MAIKPSRLVARLLWIIPGILLFLTIDQIDVALDVRRTLEEGEHVMAEVVEIYASNRVDVTIGSAQLRIPVDGSVVERELPLPLTFAQDLQGRDSLEVVLSAGAEQDIVIADIGRPQWRLAAINAAMSFVGLVLVTIGVFAWNRYLKRRGDPAEIRQS